MPLTLHQIEAAVWESWGTETCDPADLPWSAERPSRGQCSATALVLNDLLGGELLMAEVVYDDGTHQGFHGWNRLAGGVDSTSPVTSSTPARRCRTRKLSPVRMTGPRGSRTSTASCDVGCCRG